jgi:drug/metabolite transporter (DMT)-like permease
LGFCFCGLFFVLYNIAVGYTTAARASLALSTLPLQTMVVGAILGVEAVTARKSAGVCIAVIGVSAALASGLSGAPPDAWRGEIIMADAVPCLAFYNVWSRPFIERSSALGFLTVGMGSGAVHFILFGLLTGRVVVVGSFGPSQWVAGIYLGVGGGVSSPSSTNVRAYHTSQWPGEPRDRDGLDMRDHRFDNFPGATTGLRATADSRRARSRREAGQDVRDFADCARVDW